jgi:enoyl-CoA hydratase
MPVTTEKSGPVWTIIHHRPDARNAVDPEHADALYAAFDTFDRDPSASVAVFWGAGGAFCAGYDLKYAATLSTDAPPIAQDFPNQADPPSAPPRGPMGPSRMHLSKPVIAAIEGPAVAGGMELALWADVRVMAETAYMGVYCRRWGVPLIDGGTVRLPRLVGQGRALEIILTGRQIAAEECHRIGCANGWPPMARRAPRPRPWRMRSRGFPRPASAQIGRRCI